MHVECRLEPYLDAIYQGRTAERKFPAATVGRSSLLHMSANILSHRGWRFGTGHSAYNLIEGQYAGGGQRVLTARPQPKITNNPYTPELLKLESCTPLHARRVTETLAQVSTPLRIPAWGRHSPIIQTGTSWRTFSLGSGAGSG